MDKVDELGAALKYRGIEQNTTKASIKRHPPEVGDDCDDCERCTNHKYYGE